MFRELNVPSICNFDIFDNIYPTTGLASKTLSKIRFYMWVVSNSASTSKFLLSGCGFNNALCTDTSQFNVNIIGNTYTLGTVQEEVITLFNDEQNHVCVILDNSDVNY
jgi:hypothetical protein